MLCNYSAKNLALNDPHFEAGVFANRKFNFFQLAKFTNFASGLKNRIKRKVETE